MFEDVDNVMQEEPKVNEKGDGIISNYTQPMGIQKPRFDNFRYDNAIGDSLFDGRKENLVPSWKVISLNSNISSSSQKLTDTTITELNIPQVNLTVNYKKVIKSYDSILEIDGYPSFNSDSNNLLKSDSFISSIFSDNNVIELEMDDPFIYIDEVNTEVLTENFDIEVFIEEDGEKDKSLKRKFFKNKIPQIVDGIMMSDRPKVNYAETPNKSAVEYYFDVLKDENVDQESACKLSSIFNKQSYLVSLDFDCEMQEKENFYNDIYGSEVIPEICLD